MLIKTINNNKCFFNLKIGFLNTIIEKKKREYINENIVKNFQIIKTCGKSLSKIVEKESFKWK